MGGTNRKQLPQKLKLALSSYKQSPKAIETVFQLLEQLNETYNKPEFEHDNIRMQVNEALYSDETVGYLIQLLPFFEQRLQNATSTLLQSSIRVFPEKSLPPYLIHHSELLNTIFDYFTRSKEVMNVAHIIFRACCVNEDFVTYLYEKQHVMCFIQYLIFPDAQFNYLTTAFSTYDTLLNSFSDISGQHIQENWEIYSIQFKLILASKQYIMHLNFLPILFKFLTNGSCRAILLSYLADIENLQLLMVMLSSGSSKVQYHAYSILKLFVLNPHKEATIQSALTKNKASLVKIIKSLTLDDPEEKLVEEKAQVIMKLESLK